MDVPAAVASALGIHEICDDLKQAVTKYVATTIADFEVSRNDPDLEDIIEILLTDLRLMQDSIESRVWGFNNKSESDE